MSGIAQPIFRPIYQPIAQAIYAARIGGGPAPFDPASLYVGGKQGAFYDSSDFSTMFQDAAGTTPVTAVGQPVGLIRDKSPNHNDASQATSTKRPLLQVDGNGKYYLQFDGVDDYISYTGVICSTLLDFMGGMLRSSQVGACAAESSTSSVRYIGVFQSGSSSLTSTGAANPVDYVNGSAVSPDTRGSMYTALSTTVPHVVEIIGTNATTWTGLAMGYAAATTGFVVMYPTVLRSTLSTTERNNLRTWVGSKCGVSL